MAWLPLKIISLERGGLETATRGPRRRFFERDRIMRMDIKKRIMAASTGAVMAASLAVAPAAGAATAPVGGETATPDAYCAEEYWTSTTVTSNTFKQSYSAYSSVSGAPGVRLTIATGRTFGVSGDITGELSGDVSAIVAGVSAKVGTRVGVSYSSTNTVSGAWTVPSTYTNGGKLAIGAKRAQGTWKRQMLNRSCDVVTLRSGSFYTPWQQFYFQHFKL